jgi:hypothetical protein
MALAPLMMVILLELKGSISGCVVFAPLLARLNDAVIYDGESIPK